MPPKNAEKIKDATVYMDGKPIGKIEEITLPQIQVRKKTVKDIAIGFVADVVTVVCTTITKFLLWIQNRR